jgi:excisionase family DNA binding protein
VEEKLLTIEEVAKGLGVSIWTVRSWIRKGLLKRVKMERAVRIREEELNRFIMEREGYSGTSILRMVGICERANLRLDFISGGVAHVLCRDGRIRRFPLSMFDDEGVS